MREEEGDLGPRLYRTFDSIDHIFNFNYLSARELSVPEAQMNSSERLYIGSGYGRVGLVFSILNPELGFIGYEFVKNRVDVSN